MLMITLFLLLSLSFTSLFGASIPPKKDQAITLPKKALKMSIPMVDAGDDAINEELEDLFDSLLVSVNQIPELYPREHITQSPTSIRVPNMATPKPENSFYPRHAQAARKHGSYSPIAMKALKSAESSPIHKASSADTFLAFQKYAQEAEKPSDVDTSFEEEIIRRHSE